MIRNKDIHNLPFESKCCVMGGTTLLLSIFISADVVNCCLAFQSQKLGKALCDFKL